LATDAGVGVDLGASGTLTLRPDVALPLPHLTLLADPTDNWSHSVDRFPEVPGTAPIWEAPVVVDAGPLMGSLFRQGRLGDSTLIEEWRVYADEPCVELHLTVNWREQRHLLKLVWPLGALGDSRLDGIMGAHLTRPNNGQECPLRDWTRLAHTALPIAVVSPDIFALDATPDRTRFTLLRSPLLTQHDPFPFHTARAVYADQGEHHFRIRFLAGAAVSPASLDQQALCLHRPPRAGDLTRGMPRGR
jgi:alpha-mannosidase